MTTQFCGPKRIKPSDVRYAVLYSTKPKDRQAVAKLVLSFVAQVEEDQKALARIAEIIADA
jgi:hypothetical protein